MYNFKGTFIRRFCSSQPLWPAKVVRKTFLDYFQSLGCTHVPSSTVLPKDDPTLLFVNAGMNQFKRIFLTSPSDEARPSRFRKLHLATNSQWCLRIGGKHSDLDQVGSDGHHHTFFEMLGNWSFDGRWSKLQACTSAWHLLTKVYRLPPDRFYVTYFGGSPEMNLAPDEETRQIWLSLGLPEERIVAQTSQDNFWEMGATGPCGPCTEIMYSGLSEETPLKDYLELWNVVFIQFDRQTNGDLLRLPFMHVDTGMGFERLCRVLQGVHDNYDTDLFNPLFARLAIESNASSVSNRTASRIVVDHARACTALAADGVRPGGKGAEKVMRRLVRRAAYRARHVLQAKPGLLARMVPDVAATLHHDDDVEESEHWKGMREIVDTLSEEEQKFMDCLKRADGHLKKLFTLNDEKIVDASEAFHLCNTYGIPVEIIEQMAVERNFHFSVDDFTTAQKLHIERSKSHKIKSERRMELTT